MKLNDLRIGTRLGGGFAIILLLPALMLLISIWRLNSMSAATRAMMDTPLTKERLTDEWFRNLSIGVMRGKAIAKSSDPSLEALFAEEVKVATARGNEITRLLATLPMGPDEQKLLDRINKARKPYLSARDSMMKAKRAGSADEANRIFDKEFTVAAPVYVASMQGFLDYQRKAIDTAAKTIDKDAVSDEIHLAWLGAFALLLGGVFARVLSRSVVQPLQHSRICHRLKTNRP